MMDEKAKYGILKLNILYIMYSLNWPVLNKLDCQQIEVVWSVARKSKLSERLQPAVIN
jgi:hypothetical protein